MFDYGRDEPGLCPVRSEGEGMATTVTVNDRETGGGLAAELTIEFLNERVTVRELIRGRVYQEVTERNARRGTESAPPIRLSEVEVQLNGRRRERPDRIDWQTEFDRALEAFHRHRFVLLVDDRQLLDLDEEVELRPGTAIVFFRLVPLIGG